MSVEIGIDMARLERFLRRGSNIPEEELVLVSAEVVKSQTIRRIQSEKTAPDGTPWEPWTEGYRQTRHAGHSLLMSSGRFLDSLGIVFEGIQAGVGSNLVFAAIHQFGGLPGMAPGPAAVPARPYLGLSEENKEELLDVAAGWLGDYLGIQT